jgi:hypothetical protein
MPPTGPVDALYASGIELICQAIGYKAAFEALQGAFEKLADSSRRHLFSIEGAFANDIAEIVARHPAWNIRFAEGDSGFQVEVAGRTGMGATRDEAEEIQREIQAAFARHNKFPGLPGVRLNSEVTEAKAEVEE